MLNVLKNDKTSLAFEVIGSYTHDDMETIEFLFEQKIKMGAKKINILIKIDKLSLDKKTMQLLLKEAVYAFKNRKRFRNIALVGNSQVKRAMFKLDKMVFKDQSKTMIEKYFDVKHMSKAWLFLKSPKEKLVYAGVKCFLKFGYYDTTINKIAKRAGLTKGGFYHHFTSKKSIFVACVINLLQSWEEMLKQVDEESEDSYHFLQNCFGMANNLEGQLLLMEGANFDAVVFNYQQILNLGILTSKRIKNATIKIKESFYLTMKKRLEQGQIDGQIREDMVVSDILILLFSAMKGMPSVALLSEKKEFGVEVKKSFLAFWQLIKALD